MLRKPPALQRCASIASTRTSPSGWAAAVNRTKRPPLERKLGPMRNIHESRPTPSVTVKASRRLASVPPRDSRPSEKQQPDCQHRVARDVDRVDERREGDVLLAENLVPEVVGGVTGDEQQDAATEEPPGCRRLGTVVPHAVGDCHDGRQAEQRPRGTCPGHSIQGSRPKTRGLWEGIPKGQYKSAKIASRPRNHLQAFADVLRAPDGRGPSAQNASFSLSSDTSPLYSSFPWLISARVPGHLRISHQRPGASTPFDPRSSSKLASPEAPRSRPQATLWRARRAPNEPPVPTEG